MAQSIKTGFHVIMKQSRSENYRRGKKDAIIYFQRVIPQVNVVEAEFRDRVAAWQPVEMVDGW